MTPKDRTPGPHARKRAWIQAAEQFCAMRDDPHGHQSDTRREACVAHLRARLIAGLDHLRPDHGLMTAILDAGEPRILEAALAAHGAAAWRRIAMVTAWIPFAELARGGNLAMLERLLETGVDLSAGQSQAIRNAVRVDHAPLLDFALALAPMDAEHAVQIFADPQLLETCGPACAGRIRARLAACPATELRDRLRGAAREGRVKASVALFALGARPDFLTPSRAMRGNDEADDQEIGETAFRAIRAGLAPYAASRHGQLAFARREPSVEAILARPRFEPFAGIDPVAVAGSLVEAAGRDLPGAAA